MATYTLLPLQDYAEVSTNGTHTVVPVDPALIPDLEVTVKNGAAQVGTTTIDPPGSATIDGASTLALTGAYAWVTLKAHGGNYKITAASAGAGGAVTSVTAGAGLTGGGTGAVTLNVAAANGTITVSADSIEVGSGIVVSKLAGGGTANRVVLTTDGTNVTMGQVNLATAQVTGTLPTGNQAAQTLAGDVTGTTAANTLVAVTGSGGAVTVGTNVRFDWGSGNGRLVAGSAAELLLDANTISMRTNGGGYRGRIDGTSGAGLWRLGDSTASTHTLEVAGVFQASVASTIGTIEYIAANGQIKVPTASAELLLDADVLSIRDRTGGYRGRVDGTSGAGKWRIGDSTAATRTLEIGSGGTTKFVFDTSNGSIRIGDGTTATHAIEIIAGGGIYFDPSVSTPVITQGTSAASAGQSMILAAQSAGGSNHDGGALGMSGGAATGAGLPGSAAMNTGDNGCTIQTVVIGESQHVVALARAGGLTSTQMPASTGDGVIYIANAATPPSANPVGGGILYNDAGTLKYRGPSGTVTPLGLP